MRNRKIAIIPIRTVLIALIGLAVVGGIVYYYWGTQNSTRIVVYSPVGFHATEELNGSCFTGSIAAQRAGAFRCTAGNSIYDPCFVKDGTVACPVGDPNKNEGTLLRLTSPLPQPPEAWENPPDLANPKPWYVKLAGGGVCGVLTGTRPSPDFPLGCQIPGVAEPPYCLVPVPLAQDVRTYVSVCGIYDEQTRDIVQQKGYLVTEMWL